MIHFDILVAEYLGIPVSLVLAEDRLDGFDGLGLADGCPGSLAVLVFAVAHLDNRGGQVSFGDHFDSLVSLIRVVIPVPQNLDEGLAGILGVLVPAVFVS